jgi:hypothetical protein
VVQDVYCCHSFLEGALVGVQNFDEGSDSAFEVIAEKVFAGVFVNLEGFVFGDIGEELFVGEAEVGFFC